MQSLSKVLHEVNVSGARGLNFMNQYETPTATV